MYTRRTSAFIVGLLLVPLYAIGFQYVFAQTPPSVQTLQNQINDKNSQLTEIDKQIAQYESDLKKVGAHGALIIRAII